LLALDTLFLNATGLVIVLGMYWTTTQLFEGAFLVAMLGLYRLLLWHVTSPGHVID
jgi:multicomponent K+:H+ antiporter subunit F